MRVIKRVSGALSGLLAIALSATPQVPSQAVIENPAKPKAANAGRAIVPEEVLTITDEGTSDFYFYMPRDPRIAPDGSLLFSDRDQILLFGADGEFRRNFFKKGQGPGEVTYFGVCWPTTPKSASSNSRWTRRLP